jgi:hypothetical protein
MPLYDPHPIIKHLESSPYYDQADDSWSAFKETFSVKPPEWRLESLNALDAHLANEDRITHDHARLLTMKRELAGIHTQMRKAGR